MLYRIGVIKYKRISSYEIKLLIFKGETAIIKKRLYLASKLLLFVSFKY